MEMRSLARCLRSGPITSYAKQQPSTLLRGQFLAGARSLRYSSSDNGPSQPPSSNNQDTSSKSPFPSATPSTSQARQESGRSDYDEILDKLNLGSHRQPSSQDASSLSRAVGQSAGTDNYRPIGRRVELKLGPSLGRQVHVEPEKGRDLASALRMLGSACAQNKIPQEKKKQKFHVRRGQVRKNLRMERWRKLFKFSFGETVSKIQRMRAQGW
jgi:small subunit ribosomal protein MRP21